MVECWRVRAAYACSLSDEWSAHRYRQRQPKNQVVADRVRRIRTAVPQTMRRRPVACQRELAGCHEYSTERVDDQTEFIASSSA